MALSTVEAHERADWRRVIGVYSQLSSIVDDPERENEPPEYLAGYLAESLGRVFASYDGIERDFIDDFLAIMSESDDRPGTREELFRFYYDDTRFDRLAAYVTPTTASGKRRPKPFEAAVETARRLSDLNRIRDHLYDLPTAAILGGSASYGRFFNTIGGRQGNASDLDLLVVVRSYDAVGELLERLGRVNGVEGLREAEKRVAQFAQARELIPKGARCLFSHKLKMWDTRPDELMEPHQLPSRYTLSLHVISTDDLGFVILSDLPIIEDDVARKIWDFRDQEPKREDNQRCFAGLDKTVTRDYKPVGDASWVAESWVCEVADGRYYPGLHQNLVLPQFDLRWEMPRHRLALALLAFRWKLVERLRQEKSTFPFEDQALSYSHTRSATFAPHIVRRVNAHG